MLTSTVNYNYCSDSHYHKTSVFKKYIKIIFQFENTEMKQMKIRVVFVVALKSLIKKKLKQELAVMEAQSSVLMRIW